MKYCRFRVDAYKSYRAVSTNWWVLFIWCLECGSLIFLKKIPEMPGKEILQLALWCSVDSRLALFKPEVIMKSIRTMESTTAGTCIQTPWTRHPASAQPRVLRQLTWVGLMRDKNNRDPTSRPFVLETSPTRIPIADHLGQSASRASCSLWEIGVWAVSY